MFIFCPIILFHHFLCIIYSRECWGSVLVLMSGWIHWFARSLDAEAETPILWPPDSKNQIGRAHV